MEIISFLHVKLDIEDLDRSMAFYCGLLRLREICKYSIPNGTIVQLSPTGTPPGVELWYEQPSVTVRETHIHIAFEVDNVAAWIQNLRSRGVEIERESFQIGHETIAFIRDPDGYLIELNQVTT